MVLEYIPILAADLWYNLGNKAGLNMKPKTFQNHSNLGFTLIELLVIISIILVIAGAVIVNFAGQRESRSLIIARNETITNLRKVQAFTLSSRTLPSGNGAKFYIVSFNDGASTYNVRAINNSYELEQIEEIDFPGDVLVDTLTTGDCMQVIFSAPFGTMYTSESCDSDLGNVLRDPIQVANLSQGSVTVSLQTDQASGTALIFQISPLTGQIVPTTELIGSIDPEGGQGEGVIEFLPGPGLDGGGLWIMEGGQ